MLTFNRDGLLPTTLLILALAACSGFWTKPPAQTTFQRTYGGTDTDLGYSVAQTTDGGYVIAGWTLSFGAGESDVYLVKTNASGDTMWTRTCGGAGSEYGESVLQTADGGYVAAGWTDSYGTYGDVWLIKTDTSGDTMWTRTYGGTDHDHGYSVAQTLDGGFVIAGYTWSFGAGESDVYLVKTDESGDTTWTRTYGGTDYDRGYSVAQTSDGGFVIAGWTKSFGAGRGDAWLIKTDASGDTIWTRTYGGTDYDRGYSVAQTSDGGYVIAGWTRSFGAGECDVYLVKTDDSGDTLWTRTYGGTDLDEGNSVAQTADGGYIIAGYTRPFGANYYDAWLIKTDAYGDTMWTRTFSGTSHDHGYSVAQTADGGFVIAGYTCSFGAGGPDVWLIKTDSAGNSPTIAEAEPPVLREPSAFQLNPSDTRRYAAVRLTGLEPEAEVEVLDASGRVE